MPSRPPAAPRPGTGGAPPSALAMRVDRDGPARAGVLARRSTRAGRGPRRGPARCEPFPLHVDGRPAQAEQLAATQPVEHRQSEGRLPAVVGDRVEEALRLVLGPTPRPRAHGRAWPPVGHADASGWAATQLADAPRRRRAPRAAPSGRSGCCGATCVRPRPGPSSQRATSSRSRRSTRIAPSPALMWTPPTRTAAGPSPTRRLDRPPTLDEMTDRAAVGSDAAVSGERRRRRLRRSTRVNVPSCRGRCLPVSVSMPSTRTTHLLALLAHRRSTRRLPRHVDPL